MGTSAFDRHWGRTADEDRGNDAYRRATTRTPRDEFDAAWDDEGDAERKRRARQDQLAAERANRPPAANQPFAPAPPATNRGAPDVPSRLASHVVAESTGGKRPAPAPRLPEGGPTVLEELAKAGSYTGDRSTLGRMGRQAKGVLDVAGGFAGDMAEHVVTHPIQTAKDIVTAPIRALPTEGKYFSDRIRGLFGGEAKHPEVTGLDAALGALDIATVGVPVTRGITGRIASKIEDGQRLAASLERAKVKAEGFRNAKRDVQTINERVERPRLLAKNPVAEGLETVPEMHPALAGPFDMRPRQIYEQPAGPGIAARGFRETAETSPSRLLPETTTPPARTMYEGPAGPGIAQPRIGERERLAAAAEMEQRAATPDDVAKYLAERDAGGKKPLMHRQGPGYGIEDDYEMGRRRMSESELQPRRRAVPADEKEAVLEREAIKGESREFSEDAARKHERARNAGGRLQSKLSDVKTAALADERMKLRREIEADQHNVSGDYLTEQKVQEYAGTEPAQKLTGRKRDLKTEMPGGPGRLTKGEQMEVRRGESPEIEPSTTATRRNEIKNRQLMAIEDELRARGVKDADMDSPGGWIDTRSDSNRPGYAIAGQFGLLLGPGVGATAGAALAPEGRKKEGAFVGGLAGLGLGLAGARGLRALEEGATARRTTNLRRAELSTPEGTIDRFNRAARRGDPLPDDDLMTVDVDGVRHTIDEAGNMRPAPVKPKTAAPARPGASAALRPLSVKGAARADNAAASVRDFPSARVGGIGDIRKGGKGTPSLFDQESDLFGGAGDLAGSDIGKRTPAPRAPLAGGGRPLERGAIDAEEMRARRDELGAPKSEAEATAGPDQTDMLKRTREQRTADDVYRTAARIRPENPGAADFAEEIAETMQLHNLSYDDAVKFIDQADADFASGKVTDRLRAHMEQEQPDLFGGVKNRTGAIGIRPASTPALEKISRSIATGERKPGPRAGIMTKPGRAYAGFVSEVAPLEKLGRKFDVSNPNRLAETVAEAQGWGTQARQFIDDEFQPVVDIAREREADIAAFVKAQREVQLRAQGSAEKSAFTDDELAAAVADGMADPAVRAGGKRLQNYYRRLLELRRDAGVISQEKFDAIVATEDFYTPFVREWGGEQAMSGGVGGGKFTTKPGGGGRRMDRLQQARAQTVDPFEQAIVDTADTFREIGKQRVTNIVSEIVEANPVALNGLVKRIGNFEKADPLSRRIETNIGGKQRTYEVLDKDLYEAWASLDQKMLNPVVQALALPKRGVTAGVVLDPIFAMLNLMRDTGQASVQQPLGQLARRGATGAGVGAAAGIVAGDKDEGVFTRALTGAGLGAGVATFGGQALKNLRAMKNIIADDAVYKDFLRSGAVTEGFYPSGALSLKGLTSAKAQKSADARKILTELRRDGIKASDIVSPARWVDALKFLGTTAERSTRLAKFKEVGAAGGTRGQQVFAAQDVSLRFANTGKWTKEAAAVTPFWNAKVQGWDKLARLLKDPKTYGAAAMTITAPSLALWAVNKDDPAYWDTNQYVRNLFWMVPKPQSMRDNGGGNFWYVPKPFEIGYFFASLPERLADYAYLKKTGLDEHPAETLGEAVKQMATQTIEGTAPVPTVARLAAEQTAGEGGWDYFRGQPIVSRPDLPNEMQEDERTSSLARLVGKTGLSPQRVDHIVRGLTGRLGGRTLDLISSVAKSTGVDDAAGTGGARPFLAGPFWRNEGTATDPEISLRRRWADADRVYRGAKELEKEVTQRGGDPAEIDAYFAKHRDELVEREDLQEAVKALDDITTRRRSVRRDRRLTSKQRDEEIAALRLLAREIAQYGIRGAPQPTEVAGKK